ncbi:transcriptional coactivator p15/PC4 family protein [Ruegeria atlantica]|uniref:transcriptional coactivator p15/PC4 family protein n=1 Tax=Ruegeria atlantica TaxID=81569 RepID=UPI00147E3E74|nr:transcriptional coactivator p15/PC4 family protein [Ruegeria atlantica]
MSIAIKKNKAEEIRVSREEYMGHDLVTVRVWFKAETGIMHPTKKGVAFSAALLPDIQQALTEVAQEGGER